MATLWNIIEEDRDQVCFLNFKIIHILRVQNQISDSLPRTARSLYRELCFIGCSP